MGTALVYIYCQQMVQSSKRRTKAGVTALLMASAFERSATIQLCLEHGARLEAKDNYGHTALSLGAKFEVKDTKGMKPLMLATEKGHEVIIGPPLKKGAETGPKDKTGRTALSLASENGNKAIVQLLNKQV